MNKLRAEAKAFARALADSEFAFAEATQLFVIPPFTAVTDVADILVKTRVRIGVQNLHWADAGAWTGEISGAMAADCGASLAEIGHSERRRHFGETDETVALKVAAAMRHGLTPLICVGETREQYENGESGDTVVRQIRAALAGIAGDNTSRPVIAYEPVWSIGEDGTAASPTFASEQHARIKIAAYDLTGREVRVLYGGSVDVENCVALAAASDIDGLFIGRSAWQAEGYLAIVRSVLESRA